MQPALCSLDNVCQLVPRTPGRSDRSAYTQATHTRILNSFLILWEWVPRQNLPLWIKKTSPSCPVGVTLSSQNQCLRRWPCSPADPTRTHSRSGMSTWMSQSRSAGRWLAAGLPRTTPPSTAKFSPGITPWCGSTTRPAR